MSLGGSPTNYSLPLSLLSLPRPPPPPPPGRPAAMFGGRMFYAALGLAWAAVVGLPLLYYSGLTSMVGADGDRPGGGYDPWTAPGRLSTFFSTT